MIRVKGFCTGNNERWYFDQESQSCKTFTYGGCFGNSNNFLSRDECEDSCLVDIAVTEEMCDLNIDAGPCRGQTSRWGYDKMTGQCVQFQYGGCKGNQNRFMTLEDCQNVCNYKKQIFEVTATKDNYRVIHNISPKIMA